MGAYSGPDINENGLVLALDVGNLKSYDKFENLVTDVATDYNYSFNNQIIATALDIAPDGNNVLCKHDLTGATSPFLNCRANTTLSAGQTYTMSMWLKGTTSFSASFAFVGETTNEIYANTANITTSWNRFTLTFTLTNTQTSSRLQVFFGTQGNDKVISVWGAQLERGSEATDYTTRTSGVAKLRGTTWTDLSGNSNNGTLVNYPTYSGSNNGSLSFDGTNDYISISNNTSLQFGNNFTLSVWLYATNLSSRYAVFSTRFNNSSGSWQLEVGVANGGSGRIAVTGVGTWIWESSSNVIETNRWYSISYISSNNTLYLNGVLLTPLVTTAYSIQNNSDIKVISSGTSGGQFFPGNIEQVSIYNKALTASEIQQNYNATKSRFGF